MFKDFLGKELQLGDKVITCPNYYKEFRKGEILKFTPKMVKVAICDSSGKPTENIYLAASTFLIKYED
jgi:hypothetical protein